MNPPPLTVAPEPPVTTLVAPRTKMEAALESVWVTFVALGGGMWIAAVAAGAHTPAALLAYLKANWVAWFAANLIAPAIRFYRQHPTA